ncbi:uncharacterized protein EV420DRAFT_1749942 [Desarmillaria tabescens]|uniref:MYND-type domain-containing protein n=1 Tax=Armillaria tabescens TaxID=1929756 RepID=A0AA39MZ11_ARMTA|nr:uncharacterized protein EV420DRAFT_1749942 [Desarmillaria tabescens]KAK0452131.1 hypothetical protein EV420DRAFT_1749942 [Desarmillaria tabescens]
MHTECVDSHGFYARQKAPKFQYAHCCIQQQQGRDELLLDRSPANEDDGRGCFGACSVGMIGTHRLMTTWATHPTLACRCEMNSTPTNVSRFSTLLLWQLGATCSSEASETGGYMMCVGSMKESGRERTWQGLGVHHMIYRPLSDGVGGSAIGISNSAAISLYLPPSSMAGRDRTRRHILTRDFNSPEMISKIYEIAYVWGDTVPSESSILPPYLEAFRHHLSTTNIPPNDANNTDLSLIRACFFAFGKGVSALHEVPETEALWEDILRMTDTILSWTRYLFRSFDMSISLEDNPALEDGNLSSIAYLLSSMVESKRFRLSLSSEPHLIAKSVHFWLALSLHGYQSAYEFRALMAALSVWEDTMPTMEEALSRLEMENVATVIIRDIIEDQSRQPPRYTDYIRGATLLTLFGGTSDHLCDCLVARRSIMWCCQMGARAAALQYFFAYVYEACRTYVYNLAEALDFRFLEEFITPDIFQPKFYEILAGVLELAETFTVYRSVLRRILRFVRHADKFESTLGEGRTTEGWYSLKTLALEREEGMHRYDMEENKGRFICENQQCPNKEITPRTSSRRCEGCLNVMYCSPECQKIDWKAIPGHRSSCLENQSKRKGGRPYGISCIDFEFCFERCKTDIQIHMNLIRALRAQNLSEQARTSEPVATSIVMSYCGPGRDVKMLRRDISTYGGLIGEDKWRLLKKTGEEVIIIMEMPYTFDKPAYSAFPLSSTTDGLVDDAISKDTGLPRKNCRQSQECAPVREQRTHDRWPSSISLQQMHSYNGNQELKHPGLWSLSHKFASKEMGQSTSTMVTKRAYLFYSITFSLPRRQYQHRSTNAWSY